MKHYPPHHYVSMSPESDSPIVWHSGTQLMLDQHRQLVWRNLPKVSTPAGNWTQHLSSALSTTPQGHLLMKLHVWQFLYNLDVLKLHTWRLSRNPLRGRLSSEDCLGETSAHVWRSSKFYQGEWHSSVTGVIEGLSFYFVLLFSINRFLAYLLQEKLLSFS